MRKIVLTTLPAEGEYVDWTTPKFFLSAKTLNYMPLGILSLASNLGPGNEVVILDPPTEGWTIEETVEQIELQHPDILGISATSRRAFALNEILKRTSAPYTAVGGPHATYYAELILKNGADAVFVGALADLEFRAAVENKPTGVIQCTTRIEDINYPKRELLEVEKYFPKAGGLFRAENRLPMFASIGCPNSCLFCDVQSKKLQFKRPDVIVDEMQYLCQLGSKSVHILDDTFNVNRNHVLRILDEMDRRDFRVEWSGRGQVKMDLSLAEPLAASGFKRIHAGIEALDDGILEFFRKPETVSDVEKLCERMNMYDVDVLGYFIMGSPVEPRGYVEKLPRRIRELGIKYPYFNNLFPEPNTGYYRQLLEDGYYKKDHWAEFMEAPTPYYEIPYAYGKKRKQEVIDCVNDLISQFNSDFESSEPVSVPIAGA